ncbi:MAG: LptF/LptG family permease [Brevinematales bacterium]
MEKLKDGLKRFFLSKIDVYFYQELLPNYMFGLLFFTLILMLDELFYRIQDYVQYNMPFGQVFMLLFNEIPFMMTLTIPLSILPAYLLTLGRLSSDSEITAMKSCGISTLRIIRPGIVMGVIVMLFSFVFTDRIVIPSSLTYVRLKAQLMSQKPAVELKENKILDVGGLKIVYEREEQENNIDVLYNVHIIEIGGRKTIEAEKGRIYVDPENPEHYILKFINGSLSEVNKPAMSGEKEEEKFFIASFRYLYYNTYLTLPKEYYTKNPDTMTLKELAHEIASQSKSSLDQIANYLKDKNRVMKDVENFKKTYVLEKSGLTGDQAIKKAQEYEEKIKAYRTQIDLIDKNISNYDKNLNYYYIMKYYEKFALPLASLAFALIGLSLGMFTLRSGRNEGLGISIIIMLMFYGLKFGTEILIQKQTLPPVMEWFPNGLFMVIGTVLLAFKVRN